MQNVALDDLLADWELEFGGVNKSFADAYYNTRAVAQEAFSDAEDSYNLLKIKAQTMQDKMDEAQAVVCFIFS